MVLLVGFYLRYIKSYTYIIIVPYKGINVIIIVWINKFILIMFAHDIAMSYQPMINLHP